MSALPTLIADAEGRTQAVKVACDNLMGWLDGSKAGMAACEAEWRDALQVLRRRG
jgi:hypothetical protein